MQLIAIESVPRLALNRTEAAQALGGQQLLDDLIEHGGLVPVKSNRKQTLYATESLERALRLAEAHGELVKS